MGNRKLCLGAGSVCEPREETRGLEPRPLRKQCRLTPGSLRERGDCSAKVAKVFRLDSVATAGTHCCCQSEEPRLQ